MASVMRLPVIFFCENNLYSELTPTRDMVCDDALFKRAAAYPMPGERIDGNDPVAVCQAVQRAASRARAGKGPTLLEAMTERLVGHYIGDAETYRPPGEVAAALEREPLTRLRVRLLEMGVHADKLERRTEAVRSEVQTHAARALEAPLADASRVKEHLYA